MKNIHGYIFNFGKPFHSFAIYEMDKRVIMIEESTFSEQPDNIIINDVVYNIIWKKTRVLKKTYKQMQKYFNHKLRTFDIPCDLSVHGDTPFLDVINAVQTIAYGTTLSYTEFAKTLDVRFNPSMIKAINSNPLPVLIPTHRITKADGTISGKHADLFSKLIELEKNV